MNLTANRCDLYSVTSSKIFPVSEGRRFFRSRYKIWSPSHEMLRAEFFWMPLLYYMSVTNWSICNAIKHGVPRRGGGGVGVINKIVSGTLDPVIQILTLRTLHPIYCRKCIVFKIWINDKTKIFFLAFLTARKCICYPFWAFLQHEMTDFPCLWCSSTSEIRTLSYTWSLKKVPLTGGASLYRPL